MYCTSQSHVTDTDALLWVAACMCVCVCGVCVYNGTSCFVWNKVDLCFFFCFFSSWFDCVCLNVWSYCYRLHSQMISGALRVSQWKLRALSQTAATLASQLIRGSRRSSYRARQHVIIGRHRGHRTLLFLFLFLFSLPPSLSSVIYLYSTFLAPLSGKLTGQVRSGKRKSLKWG